MRTPAMLALLAAVATAADTPGEAAERILEAVAAKDAASLAALAGRNDPDPWLVADELLSRGRADAADAFARAAPRKATEALPAYVLSQRGRPAQPSATTLLASLSALNRSGDFAGALKAAEEVRAPLDTVTGVGVAYAASRALRGLGRLDEGRAKAAEAAAAAEKLGWLRRAAWCRLEEGNCLNDGRHPAPVIEAWESAIPLAEAGGDPKLTLILLDELGGMYRGLGGLRNALACSEKALPLHEQAGDHGQAMRTLRGIGALHVELGDPRRGLEFLERARQLFDEAGDNEGLAGTWINMGNAHEALGEYAKAFACEEEALRRMEAIGDGGGIATALNALGNLHRSVGDPARALACYERALRLAEEAGQRDLVAVIPGNIAAAYSSLGEPAKELEWMERALKAREELGNLAWIAIALDNLGVLRRSQGDPEGALELAERARALSEKVGDRNGVASALANAGRAHKDLGQPEKALTCLHRALALQEEAGDDEGAARTRWALCSVHGALGDHARACAEAREAVLLASRLGHGLADETQASKREQFTDLYGAGAFAGMQLGDAPAVAFFLEAGRAGALLETLRNREALASVALPTPLRARDTAARSREAAAAAALRQAATGGDVATVRAARAELERARRDLAEVAIEAQREAKGLASVLYAATDDLATIRGRLGPAEALVLYGVFPGEDHAVALVVTAKEPRIVPLGKSGPIEKACAALKGAEADPEAAAALRRLLLEPLALDAATTRLLVSPDGALSYVPFALLAPGREIAYVPSGTTYGILLDDRAKRGDGVLALGDPDYASAAPKPALALRGGHDLARLPATAAEAKSVGDVVLLGKDASEPGLVAALAKRPRWRAVHFACHGLVDPERPMLSALALAPAGEDDGFLTALDILRLKVPADLAVLSACETGKGRIYRSEGIVGLVRAFLLVGTPRVLVSLWKVDDDATRALMERFYEAWKKGAPAARALREAQDFVRDQPKWRHPRYWAAWALWGLPE